MLSVDRKIVGDKRKLKEHMAQIKGTTIKTKASKPVPKPTPKPVLKPSPPKVVTSSNSAAMAERKMNEEAKKVVSTPVSKPVTPPPPPPTPKPVVTTPVTSKSVMDANEIQCVWQPNVICIW